MKIVWGKGWGLVPRNAGGKILGYSIAGQPRVTVLSFSRGILHQAGNVGVHLCYDHRSIGIRLLPSAA